MKRVIYLFIIILLPCFLLAQTGNTVQLTLSDGSGTVFINADDVNAVYSGNTRTLTGSTVLYSSSGLRYEVDETFAQIYQSSLCQLFSITDQATGRNVLINKNNISNVSQTSAGTAAILFKKGRRYGSLGSSCVTTETFAAISALLNTCPFTAGGGGGTTSVVTDNGNNTYNHNDGAATNTLIDTREGVSTDAGNLLTVGADLKPYYSEGITVNNPGHGLAQFTLLSSDATTVADRASAATQAAYMITRVIDANNYVVQSEGSIFTHGGAFADNQQFYLGNTGGAILAPSTGLKQPVFKTQGGFLFLDISEQSEDLDAVGVTSNIYTASGALAGNRTVTMGTNNLVFDNAAGGDFNITGKLTVAGGIDPIWLNFTPDPGTTAPNNSYYVSDGTDGFAIGCPIYKDNTGALTCLTDGTLPAGVANQTLRNTGANWVADGGLTNDGNGNVQVVSGTGVLDFNAAGAETTITSTVDGDFRIQNNGLNRALRLNTNVGGANATRILVDTDVTYPDYGTGGKTGTLAYLLGVEADGKMIDVDASALGNIYTTDGTLTGNRILEGGENSLSMQNTSSMTLEADLAAGGATRSRLSLNTASKLGFILEGIDETNVNEVARISGTTDTGIEFDGGTASTALFAFRLNNSNAAVIQQGATSNTLAVNSPDATASLFIQTDNTTGTRLTNTESALEIQNNALDQPVQIITNEGGAILPRLTVKNSRVQLNDYGGGAKTGTPTFDLQVEADGDIIEVPVVDRITLPYRFAVSTQTIPPGFTSEQTFTVPPYLNGKNIVEINFMATTPSDGNVSLGLRTVGGGLTGFGTLLANSNNVQTTGLNIALTTGTQYQLEVDSYIGSTLSGGEVIFIIE